LNIDGKVKALVVRTAPPVKEEIFAKEKISPVLSLWKYSDFEEGCLC